jgi:hypothetical protein
MVEISAACMFDSNGKAYAEDGTLYVFPAAPPYGAKFVFKAGFVPQASDVTAQGADASIGVYAAPYNVASGTQCCSEDSEANRIEATTDLSAKGELTITVSTPIPSGYQIAIILDFGRLYRSRLSPPDGGACNLPSQESCTYSTASGFAMRFYVGSVPGGAALQPASSTDPATVAAGTCLLAYNDALVSGDPCCYRKGAKNSCLVSGNAPIWPAWHSIEDAPWRWRCRAAMPPPTTRWCAPWRRSPRRRRCTPSPSTWPWCP